MPYLVRRLLENGANTSFVNRIVDARLPVAEVVRDPVQETDQVRPEAHPRIVLPEALFAPERSNSRGVNFADGAELKRLKEACERATQTPWSAAPTSISRAISLSRSRSSDAAQRDAPECAPAQCRKSLNSSV